MHFLLSMVTPFHNQSTIPPRADLEVGEFANFFVRGFDALLDVTPALLNPVDAQVQFVFCTRSERAWV